MSFVPCKGLRSGENLIQVSTKPAAGQVVLIRHIGLRASQIEQDIIHPMKGRITSLDAVWAMRWTLDPADAVAVASAGRGIERMRFWIGPRRPIAERQVTGRQVEPMPILIG
jgi:hypothetical protein